jgi:hypothetical protein
LDLGSADQKSQATAVGDQAGGYGEDVMEALDGAEGDEVEGARRIRPRIFGRRRYGWVRGQAFSEGLGAAGEYIDVRQCKGAGYFAEERSLFVVGLD